MTIQSGNQTRRDFLKTGAGLAFAIPLASKLGLAGAQTPGNGAVANSYVTLNPDNRIIIYSHASEMGQGSYTGVPMVIAEELDADWDLVDIEFSPLSDELYGNPRYYGLMLTIGSDAISTYYEKLRFSGAQIRKTLIQMAADEWRVPVSEVHTEPSLVVHPASGRSMTYGEVSTLGNVPEELPEVDESEYKRIEDYRIVNNPDIQRRDTPGKVFGGVMNGEKMFSVDVQLPGMLYATSRRNHFGNREVVRIVNEDEVLALPDVIGVEVILDSVTVIAQTYEAARKGEKLLQVEWSNAEEDARYNSDEELERLKAIAYDESREGIDVMGHWRARLRGQAGQAEGLDEALASADEVHQRLYTTGFMYHAQMETLNAVVDVTDNGQKAEVWAGTQGPTQTRMRVAEVLEIPTGNVTLHRNFMGGGFGRKAVRSHDNFVEAAMLSKKYEAPVKVIWSRENDLIAGHYRPHGAHLVTGTRNGRGAIDNFLHRTVSDEPLRWGDPERFERGGSRPYLAASFWNGAIYPAVEKFRGDVVMEFTDTRVCAMRGIGGVATAFARECFVDEMAHETGTDPLEYRRRLFEGQPESQLVFDTLKERCNWDGRPGLGCAMGSASYALAVEIDLDERTGVVKPTKIWAVASYAVVVEPNNAENSFYGQLMLYVGASTSEEITFRDGKQEQSNFHNFQIARMADVPEIDVHVIPSESRRIGTADGPAYAIGPAISNALYSLTGKRVRHLPLSPREVLKALNA